MYIPVWEQLATDQTDLWQVVPRQVFTSYDCLLISVAVVVLCHAGLPLGNRCEITTLKTLLSIITYIIILGNVCLLERQFSTCIPLTTMLMN